MFSKNIIFKNFLQKKNINVKKKINNILKKELIKSNANIKTLPLSILLAWVVLF